MGEKPVPLKAVPGGQAVARSDRPGGAGDTILVVDDERSLVSILRENLQRAGYQVLVAYDGQEAQGAFREQDFDLVILDVMLPRLDGFSLCEALRGRSQAPVLMLTAKGTEDDKLRGFEVGVDDYLTKPFSMAELLARVRALLRRQGRATDGGALEAGGIVLDPASREVRRDGELLQLSVREFDLLCYLMQRPGQLVTREALLGEVWGYDFVGDSSRTVDVTVWRLRNKIEDDPRDPKFILSRRGIGYMFGRPEG